MKTLLSGLMAAALAASFAVPLPTAASAAPVFVPQKTQSNVVNAESDRDWRYPRTSRDLWERDRWERRADRWERRRWRAYRNYRDGYYRGDPYYRSYRAYRPHRYYRRYRPGVTLEFNF